MSTSLESNKRIAKNTLFLYVRMGITMLVSLYTSRIVLRALGVEDYGVYNIVGSVIVAFSFISGPLGTATQRFYNFELGRNDKARLNMVFNHSFLIYVVLAVCILLLIESGGLWFIYHKMQLPPGRLDAAVFAFHFSVFAFVLGLIKTPFESLIVAHEKMSYYAYVSIVEVTLNLLNAYSLSVFSIDKLRLYTMNRFMVSLIVLSCVFIYCRRKFVYVYFMRIWDKGMFRSLLGFSGWSLFGSLASMSANQGLNILLNIFYGVTVNAAMGIAGQVNSAINQFVTNFQVAFRPQIVKNYASGQLDELRSLIMNTSKYSFLLLFGVVCPIVFNMRFILGLWLGDVPDYATEFCVLMLIYALLETLSAPMWMTVQATGKIRTYQLVISGIIFQNILLSYFFLRLVFPPVVVLEIKCCLDLVYLMVRLLFMRKMVRFSIRSFIRRVGLRLVVIVSLSLIGTYIFSSFSADNWMRFLSTGMGFMGIYAPIVYWVGLERNERCLVRKLVSDKLKK